VVTEESLIEQFNDCCVLADYFGDAILKVSLILGAIYATELCQLVSLKGRPTRRVHYNIKMLCLAESIFLPRVVGFVQVRLVLIALRLVMEPQIA
jgi:hypothetical protein